MRTTTFNGYQVNLVETLEDIEVFKSRRSRAVGVDTETTGLDFTKDYIVGVCLSCGNPHQGYYFPIRHNITQYNLPIDVVMALVQDCIDNYTTYFWNRNFDACMLEKEGVVIPFVGKMHDVQVMAFLATGQTLQFLKLKDHATNYLKWQVIDFEDNKAKDHNFGSTDPAVSYVYACYTPDTKFLTRTGFKYFDDILATEEIGQYNPETEEIEFVTPLRRIDTFSDTILHCKNAKVDFSVSPEHKVLWLKGRKGELAYSQAKEVFGRQLNFPTATKGYRGVDRHDPFIFQSTIKHMTNRWGSNVRMDCKNNLSLDADAFIECLGFFLGDGSCHDNGSQRDFCLCQSTVPHKASTLQWLRDLNSRLDGLFTEVTYPDARHGHPVVYFRKTHKALSSFIKTHFYTENGRKTIPQWVFQLSVRQRKLFLDAFVRADGSRRKDRTCYYLAVCENKNLAEKCLELFVSVGYTCYMSVYEEVKTSFGTTRNTTSFRIHVCEHYKKRQVQPDSWSKGNGGRVVCFTVPSGALIVQKNYRTIISGNCGDPLMTVLLGQLYWKNYPYIQKIYPLDNKTVEAMRLIGKMDVRLNYKILEELLEDAETKLRALKERIFMIAGYDFNINSRIQVADALQRFVTLTEKTDKGQWKTDEEALMKLKGPNGETFPLAAALVKYGEWNKYIGTYLRKMRNFEGNPVRINYNCVSTVTGRFSSGGVKGNPYYAPLNIQNIPKIETKMYIHPDPVIGYVLNEDPEGALGQAKTKSGLRAAFCAPNGRVWLTADFAAEELRLAANFSRDPVLLEPLKSGKDVHTHVAMKMFGFSDPEHRTHVKTINFGVMYGMQEIGLSNKIGKPVAFCKELLEKYKRTLCKLDAWKQDMIKTARKTGMLYTYFGRPRLMWQIYNKPGMSSFGDRTASNSPIQGPIVFTESNYIFTNHGYVPASKLLQHWNGSKVEGYQVWNGRKFCDFNLVDAGTANTCEVKFRNGTKLVCDARHELQTLTLTGIKYTSDFRPGDKVGTGINIPVELSDSPLLFPATENTRPDLKTFTEADLDVTAFYWVLGVLAGDGDVQKGAVRICINDTNKSHIYTRCVEFFSKLGLHTQDLYHNTGSLGKHSFTFTVTSKFFVDFITANGWDLSWNSHTKRIPACVMGATLAHRKAFLQGFYATDGSKTQDTFTWHMCQERILLDLQLLLRTCGIRANVYECRTAWLLSVKDNDAFAKFIGVERKHRCFKKYGRFQDTTKVLPYMTQHLLDFVDTHGFPLYADKKQESRDKALIHNLRKGKPVGHSTYVSLCDSLVYDHLSDGDLSDYTEIISITPTGKQEQVYCLSLWDDSHCYDANGVISHNCVPQNTYMETEHEVITFKEANLQAFKTYDGKKIIPSYRGDQEVYLFWFTRGDFIVCDMNHKLINGPENDLRESPVTGGFKKKVNLSPLHNKKWPNFKMLFKASNEAAVALKLICRTKTRINDKDSKIAAYFWKLAFTRHRFVCDPMVAASLRSLGSLYGFNVLYVQSCDEYTVRFTRNKKARFAGFKYVGKSPVACATVELGKQMFPTQGFWNKNTGGDVMRMCLCNLFSEQRNNPDFAKNVDIVLHVHDECNFYVEPSYLYEAWKIIKRIMTIHPSNFEVPLEVDMGVGYDWGHCLDFKEVTPDNKIVIDLE